MAKTPAIQLYTADLTSNAKLRRCSWAARGAWIWAMCLLHDEDEYGVFRGTLKELAAAIGVPFPMVKELADRKVLKGCDKGECEAFIFTPRHAGQDLPSVVLIPAQPGPLWYSSRMVRDAYKRKNAGASTRFGSPNAPPIHTPSRRDGERQGEHQTEHQAAGQETALRFSSSSSLLRTVCSESTGESSEPPAKAKTVFDKAAGENHPPIPRRGDEQAIDRLGKWLSERGALRYPAPPTTPQGASYDAAHSYVVEGLRAYFSGQQRGTLQ